MAGSNHCPSALPEGLGSRGGRGCSLSFSLGVDSEEMMSHDPDPVPGPQTRSRRRTCRGS